MQKSAQNHKDTIFFVWSCGEFAVGPNCTPAAVFPLQSTAKNRWPGGGHGDHAMTRAGMTSVDPLICYVVVVVCISVLVHCAFSKCGTSTVEVLRVKRLQFGLFWREVKLIGRLFEQCMIFLSERGYGMLWLPSYLSRFCWWSWCGFLPCLRWDMLCNGWDWWARVMRLAYLLLVQKLEKEMSNSSNECCEVEDWNPTKVKEQPFHTCSYHICCQILLPTSFKSRLNWGQSGSKCKVLRREA